MLLVPTWIIYIAWIFYGWLVITGQVSNDVAQPAVAGGLVLIVMLLGFTSVQHAFSEGQVSIGTLSEVERRALALTGSGDFVFDWNIERDRVSVSDELSVASRRTPRRAARRHQALARPHPPRRPRPVQNGVRYAGRTAPRQGLDRYAPQPPTTAATAPSACA